MTAKIEVEVPKMKPKHLKNKSDRKVCASFFHLWVSLKMHLLRCTLKKFGRTRTSSNIFRPRYGYEALLRLPTDPAGLDT